MLEKNTHSLLPFTWQKHSDGKGPIDFYCIVEFKEDFGNFKKGMKFDNAWLDSEKNTLQCWNDSGFIDITQNFKVIPID